MDIQTLLKNLHEEVSCPVCKTTFTKPKMLPCLHSFCLQCLEGIQRTSGRRDIIACPECRREIRVPASGNLDDLPTNFRINSLLDVLAIRECNTDGVKCGNCDKRSAQSSYCFQCSGFWCDLCITAHNIIRANREHKLLALKDFQDQDIEEVLKRPAFCPRPGHEKKELEFFCEKCEVPICNACALTSHEGHAKKLLEEAANERKFQINSMIELQKEKVQQKRNRIAKLDENCVQIEAKAAAAKQNVNRFAENLTAVIEAKRRETLNKVEIQMKKSVERLRTQQCKENNQVKLIETEIAKTEAILKRGPSAEIVQLDKLAINTIFQEGVGDEGEQFECDLEGLRQFVFVQNETLMEEAITEGIGSFKTFLNKTEAQQSSAEGKGISEATVGLEAKLVLTTRNAEGEQCYDERDSVTVDIRNRQGHDCATKARVQDNRDGTYNISYFAKETGKCDVSVKINDEHIRDSPYNVQVKPRRYRPVLSFGKEGSSAGMLAFPWGLAVNELNEIAVAETENDRVSAFDKNSDIIVADTGNHRVQIFSEQGEYLNQFGEQGSLDHQLKYPYGLSVDSDGNIIVADSGSKLIKIFSPSGQFLRKIGGERSFTNPLHCVEYDKYLIVSDSDEHCIKVFSRDEKFSVQIWKVWEGRRGVQLPWLLVS
ncbi:hypothetical protein ACROYT_G008894 [Oculina patagonica]